MADTTVRIGFGSDLALVPAGTAQKRAGAVAYLRSSVLTVNGKPASASQRKVGYRLTLSAAQAFIAAKVAEGKAGTVTLPVGKRGRKSHAVTGSSAALAAMIAPAPAPARTRTPRTPKTDAPAAPAE